MTSRNIKLRNKLRKILSGKEGVRDIIIFGSVVRGKENPSDTDILVLFKDKIDKHIEYSIRKELEKHYDNVSIISKTEGSVFEEVFDARESVLFEGVSLINGKSIAGNYGFISFGAFKYSFKGWDNLKKTKFYYALFGRRKSVGISEKLGCIKLSDSLILAPLQNVEGFREFLDGWKIEYIYIPMLLPFRLGRKKILEG